MPWIDPVFLLSGGRSKLQRQTGGGPVKRDELNRLESRIEEGDSTLEGDIDPSPGEGRMENGTWTVDVMALLPEMDRLYEKLETARTGRLIAAIDSIDSLAERYGIAPKRLIFAIQKDLVERSNANVIFILETGDSNTLDYMGDGVVILEKSEMEGRRLRAMTIEKLRGQKIWVPRYAFSLAGGHFDCFNGRGFEDVPSRTGIGHIELGGFFHNLTEPGQYNLFEFAESVPIDIARTLAATLAAETAKNSRMIYTTPSMRLFGRDPLLTLEPCIENYSDVMRFISPVSVLHRKTKDPSIVPVDGESFFADFDWNTLSQYFPNSKSHPVFLMDANQIISHYGEGALNDLENHISNLMRIGGSCVGFNWPGQSLPSVDFGMSGRLIKVKTYGPHILFFGEKPHTPIFVLARTEVENNYELMPLL